MSPPIARCARWQSFTTSSHIEPLPARQARQDDETLLLLLHAQSQAVASVLPALQAPGVWEVLVWTDDPHLAASSLRSESQELCRPAEALALLQYRPSLRAAGLTGTGVFAYAPGGERP